jgi:hypothetical protein
MVYLAHTLESLSECADTHSKQQHEHDSSVPMKFICPALMPMAAMPFRIPHLWHAVCVGVGCVSSGVGIGT